MPGSEAHAGEVLVDELGRDHLKVLGDHLRVDRAVHAEGLCAVHAVPDGQLPEDVVGVLDEVLVHPCIRS